MPPITKITRDIILRTGYELVIESGIESVNSRSIAKMMGCSTQPIFSQFASMEELKQEIHDFACDMFEKELLHCSETEDLIYNSYIKVINLAQNKPNIFKLIFLTEYCRGQNFINARMGFESNKKILNYMQIKFAFNDSESKELYEKISIVVQGIATIIASSGIEYSSEQVINIVESSLEDFAEGIIRRRKQ